MEVGWGAECVVLTKRPATATVLPRESRAMSLPRCGAYAQMSRCFSDCGFSQEGHLYVTNSKLKPYFLDNT